MDQLKERISRFVLHERSKTQLPDPVPAAVECDVNLPTPNSEPEKPSLMTLPSEIRLNILGYCLDSEYCVTEDCELGPEWSDARDFKDTAEAVMYTNDDSGELARRDDWMPLYTGCPIPWHRGYRFFPQVLRVC